MKDEADLQMPSAGFFFFGERILLLSR